MRAAVATGINEADPLSMLELRNDWPDPIAPDGHIVVRVGATSINMHDLWSMKGVGVRADEFPMVLGCDIAGWDEHGNEVVVSVSAPVDIVIETVGEATWKHSLRSVRPGGRVVVSGATTGDPSADLPRIFYRQISIIGVSGASRVETEQLLRFMEAADLHPVIDSVFAFENIHQAFQRAQHPDLFGKVVVQIGGS